jgi:hypothetical protein
VTTITVIALFSLVCAVAIPFVRAEASKIRREQIAEVTASIEQLEASLIELNEQLDRAERQPAERAVAGLHEFSVASKRVHDELVPQLSLEGLYGEILKNSYQELVDLLQKPTSGYLVIDAKIPKKSLASSSLSDRRWLTEESSEDGLEAAGSWRAGSRTLKPVFH